jgi:hypothetical protein
VAILDFLPALRHLPGDLFHIQKLLENNNSIKYFTHTKARQNARRSEQSGDDCVEFMASYLRTWRRRRRQDKTRP